MSITEFLLARIAEDEAVARAAAHQKVAGPFHGNWHHDSLHLSGMERADAQHIARHDPARVLAECAAKRAIVDEFVRHRDAPPESMYVEPEVARIVAMEFACRALAAVYADHEDYQPGWAL